MAAVAVAVVLQDGPHQTLGCEKKRYKPSRDVNSAVSIANISKGLDKQNFFGAHQKGRSDNSRSSNDLSRWLKFIVSRIKYKGWHAQFGGPIIKYLDNLDYDPVLPPIGTQVDPGPNER